MSEKSNPGESCQGALASALKRGTQNQLSLYFDKIIEVQSASFEHASKSNNGYLTVIYAGTFLLIQATKDQVDPRDWSIIVLLLFVSLITFAIWSTSSSWRISRQTIRSSKILNDPNKSIERKLAELQVTERMSQRENIRYFVAWGWAFGTTLLTGFLGAIYLLIIYVVNLFDASFSPYGLVTSFLSNL